MTAIPRELRALVVDDEEELARLVADYLRRDGFATQVAHDGEQALGLARAATPDVVILDVMLPGMEASRCAGNCVPSPTPTSSC